MGIQKQNENDFKLDVFPNPANDKIAVNYYIDKPDIMQIELYDINGNKLQQQIMSKESTGKHTFELSFLKEYEAGIYFIKLNMGNKSAYKKFVILN